MRGRLGSLSFFLLFTLSSVSFIQGQTPVSEPIVLISHNDFIRTSVPSIPGSTLPYSVLSYFFGTSIDAPTESTNPPIRSVPGTGIADTLLYPSPFSLSTGSTLYLLFGAETAGSVDVEFLVYDMKGNRIYQFRGDLLPDSSTHVATLPLGITQLGDMLPSGIYFYIVQSNGVLKNKGKFALLPR